MVNEMLRSYLTWQAEMGGDEVILPQAFKRKLAPALEAPQARESQVFSVFQHAQAFQPTSASNLFGDLARNLEAMGKLEKGSGPSVGQPSTVVPVSPVTPVSVVTLQASQAPKPVEAIQYPAFTNMGEFQDYLAKNARAVFSAEGDIQIIYGLGKVQAPLALVSLEPNEADVGAGKIFSGEPGILLEKMMRAIHLDCGELFRTSLLKHRVPGRIWSRREYAKILPLLHLELGLSQVPVVLLLGEACAQAILKTTKTMAELRQIPHREGGRDFVVTYHPDELLKREELKRKAWEDLQWLQRRMNLSQAQS